MIPNNQYDRIKGKTNTSKLYREELLANITKEIQNAKSEGITECIIARDFNPNIQHNNI